MEFKRKQSVLRKRFVFRMLICCASLLGSILYLVCDNTGEPIWGVVLGLCGSALVWALVELFDFVIQTHHQYETERNACWGFVMDHFRDMKKIIRADTDNIPMHELRKIVNALYNELNKFVFSSNVYSLSKEFEMCSNYIERMYWKFDACCAGIKDEFEEQDSYYRKLYNALLLDKEEKEATSKRFFDGFFLQKSGAKVTDLDLSFERYDLPENMVNYEVIGNISDEFTIPGNIRKTTTFIPDLKFMELYEKKKSYALFCCLCLLFRKVKVSAEDVNDRKTLKQRVHNFLKRENVKRWGKRISGAIMVGTSIYIAMVYLLVAVGSSFKMHNYLAPFVYVSFALSALVLMISKIKRLNQYVKNNRWYCLIIAIFLSFSYAALRIQLWSNVFQYEDIGTALLILASYAAMFFEKQKN